VFFQLLFPSFNPRRSGERDIVIFDQRARCTRALLLPGLGPGRRHADDNLTREEGLLIRPRTAASRTCAIRASAGVFDSVERGRYRAVAHDACYDQINLYGVSYGTLLALHTMRDHPRHPVGDPRLGRADPVNFCPTPAQSWQRGLNVFSGLPTCGCSRATRSEPCSTRP
jgi:hypothetical protein